MRYVAAFKLSWPFIMEIGVDGALYDQTSCHLLIQSSTYILLLIMAGKRVSRTLYNPSEYK